MRTVCIVDDDTHIAKGLNAILRDSFKTVIFNDPNKFLDYTCCTSNIFMALVDYKMPGLNGIDMLLKAKEKCKIKYSFLMTGVYDINNIVHAVNAVGIDHVFLKPFEGCQIIQKIADLEKINDDKIIRTILSAEEIEALTKGMEELQSWSPKKYS